MKEMIVVWLVSFLMISNDFFSVFLTEAIKEKNANDAIQHKIKYAVNIDSKQC